MPPVLAIASAVASVAGGMTALAAGSELVGGLMIAGGVASGLGALTGNKKLSMLGGLAGLAGGIAGMATGAWDNLATDAAKQASDAEYAASADAAAGLVPNQGGGVVADAANGLTGMPPSDVDSGLSANDITASNPVPGQGGPSDVSKVSNGIVDNAKPLSNPSQVNAQPGGAPAAQPGQLPTAQTPSVQPPATQPTTGDFARQDRMNDPNGVINSGLNPGSSLGSFIQRVPQWIEKNKELAKLAGGVVGGAMKSYGDQALLKQRYDLQDAYEQRQRDRYSNSVKGLQMPAYKPYSAT